MATRTIAEINAAMREHKGTYTKEELDALAAEVNAVVSGGFVDVKAVEPTYTYTVDASIFKLFPTKRCPQWAEQVKAQLEAGKAIATIPLHQLTDAQVSEYGITAAQVRAFVINPGHFGNDLQKMVARRHAVTPNQLPHLARQTKDSVRNSPEAIAAFLAANPSIKKVELPR